MLYVSNDNFPPAIFWFSKSIKHSGFLILFLLFIKMSYLALVVDRVSGLLGKLSELSLPDSVGPPTGFSITYLIDSH